MREVDISEVHILPDWTERVILRGGCGHGEIVELTDEDSMVGLNGFGYRGKGCDCQREHPCNYSFADLADGYRIFEPTPVYDHTVTSWWETYLEELEYEEELARCLPPQW